jgi:hypothetical protein
MGLEAAMAQQDEKAAAYKAGYRAGLADGVMMVAHVLTLALEADDDGDLRQATRAIVLARLAERQARRDDTPVVA